MKRQEYTASIVDAILRAEKAGIMLAGEIDPSDTDITMETMLVRLLRRHLTETRRAAADLEAFYSRAALRVESGSAEDLARL